MPEAFCHSRRRFLGALGLSATMISLPARAFAQAGAPAADGFRILRARPDTAPLRGPDQPPTPIWGYDGVTPGPLLRVRRGDELAVRLVNELAEPTAVHWHGVRLPNGMDGVPHLTQEPIAPGGNFDYRFRPPDAGTFWYHAQQMPSEQMGRGLYGALIVDEPEPVDVDHDVVLVISDWRLDAEGKIEASFLPEIGGLDLDVDAPRYGRLGNHFTANGLPAFNIAVKSNERVRLRLINAANARILPLRVDRHAASVMALDGQPAEPFVARDSRAMLAPGNRVDLFVDAVLPPGSTAPIVVETVQGEIDFAHLVYDAGPPARSAPRPQASALPANPLPQRMNFSGALKLDVPLTFWMLGDPNGNRKPLFSVKRGRTVMLGLVNNTAFAHAMHVHGHHFRLLDRLDDGWKPFWLDTVLVQPQQTTRIAFAADNPGKWMLHCQETGMAAWFEVS